MALDQARADAVKKFRGVLSKDKELEELFRDAFPGLAAQLLHEDEITVEALEAISGGPSWDTAEPFAKPPR